MGGGSQHRIARYADGFEQEQESVNRALYALEDNWNPCDPEPLREDSIIVASGVKTGRHQEGRGHTAEVAYE